MNNTELRHRITIQKNVEIVDPDTGYRTPGWVDRVLNEPAKYLAGPGREYLAGEAIRAEVTGRFEIRYSDAARAITAGGRVLWDGRVMAIKAPPLPDPTGRKSFTLMVAEMISGA